ncbi:PAS domain-containing protein [Spirosoma aureum]|uniref:histidine kinase n=1 Tax=Spirosoma aureum TaxID=2692134 RepID=A0A6G9ARA5_9BACT|nr:ATP-binding protein [Spirosoma aureum]QIP14908.1 PAS domain-containing protein [Spirosoma aureum]
MTHDLHLHPPNPLLESVFQNSLNGILLCQAIRNENDQISDFRVLRCNERAAALSGFTQEQLLTYSMLALDPDGNCGVIFDNYKQVVESGLPMHIEHHFAAADSWVAQSLARFEDCVLASWTDINDRKKAELAQKHETTLLQAILDNTQTGIAVMQSVRDEANKIIDFRFTHLNADAERITQRSKESLIGELYSLAWPGARINGVLDWHIRVAETNEPARINGVNLPVGEYNGWYNIRIRPFGDGVIATFIDVTALKRAELANQRQADLLRSVLDGSSNAIIAFSAVRDETTGKIVDFRYVAQNEANRQNPGRTDEEVIGRTMLGYFPHVIETGLFDRYVQVIETGEPTRFEQEYNYDQLKGWYELSVIKWDDGIVLTLVNITESKTHQQQLEQTNRDLQTANDNLRQFAYVANHDLQEPLRKIMAFGDILHNQFSHQLTEYGQDIVSRMQSAAGRMSSLIKDVLAYSRISTHRAPFQTVLLEQLFAEVRSEYELALHEAGAILTVGPLPAVRGDFAQMHLLFSNLIANAIKFRVLEKTLVIDVSCESVSGEAAPAELNSTQTYYRVRITDNGIGFEDKYAEQIFQVFQRLHNRQQYDGTGVGLAICRRVVENHRGAITAYGHLGKGAAFEVYLPV